MAKKAKGHISKEELQKDEVVETLSSASDFLKRNRILIIAVAIAVIGGTVGGAVWKSRQVQAGGARAEDLFQAGLFLANRHHYADPAEYETKLDEAMTSLRGLIESSGSDEVGRKAHRMLGDCYAEKREFDQALEHYKTALSAATGGEERATAEISIGLAIEGRHFDSPDPALMEEAMGRFDAAARVAPAKSVERYLALYHKARVLEILRRDSEALALYKVVMEERPAERPTPTLQETYEMVFPNQLARIAHQQLMVKLGKGSVHAMAQERHDRIVASSDPQTLAWIPVPEELKPTPAPEEMIGPAAPPRFSIPSSSVAPAPAAAAPAPAAAPAAQPAGNESSGNESPGNELPADAEAAPAADAEGAPAPAADPAPAAEAAPAAEPASGNP